MPTITLENNTYRLILDPDRGVGVVALYARQGEAWLPLMPDTRMERIPLPYASFLMMPYSNRIENGAFTFQGQNHQLAHGERHAIHGDVRSRPWRIVETTETSLRCAFNSSAHENVNWPWPFEAQAEYRLQENVLSARLALWNRGHSDMPAGFGWHSYFSRALTRDGEPVHLCFQVAGVYPDANGNRIPSGPAQPLPADQDFATERPIFPDRPFDGCFAGYDGGGYIRWPESGVQLSFHCSPECTHLILYNPAGTPYFAAEPVTNANNGINLYQRGWANSGVVILSPGACLEATFDLQYEHVSPSTRTAR